MTVYAVSLKESTNAILTINKQVYQGYWGTRLIHKKSIIFLYTSNKQLETEIKNIIITAS